MTEFTPLAAVVGGTLIGIGAVMIMLFLGRVAGISGILSGAVFASSWEEWGWRVAFLAGMIAAPAVFTAMTGEAPGFMMPGTTAVSIIAGLLVGIGVTFGAGCASGHGVCGLARVSPRSIVATAVFMFFAVATVFVSRHLIGG